MTPPGVMPHPWWQFWQIADFLIMLAVVVFFVRFVRRSDARSKAEERAEGEPELAARNQDEAGSKDVPSGSALAATNGSPSHGDGPNDP